MHYNLETTLEHPRLIQLINLSLQDPKLINYIQELMEKNNILKPTFPKDAILEELLISKFVIPFSNAIYVPELDNVDGVNL